MASDKATTSTWGSVVAELQSYRDQQQETWGDLDNTTLACYLAGEIDEDDRERVAAALAAHPELQHLACLVEEVLDDFEEEHEPEEAVSLKFEPKATAFYTRFRQMGTLLAAACLLLVIGVALFDNGGPTSRSDSSARLERKQSSEFKMASLKANSTAARERMDVARLLREGELAVLNGDLTKGVEKLDRVASNASDERIQEKARELVVAAVEKELQVNFEEVDSPPQAVNVKSFPTIRPMLSDPKPLRSGGVGADHQQPWTVRRHSGYSRSKKQHHCCPILMNKGVRHIVYGAQQNKNRYLQRRCQYLQNVLVTQVEPDSIPHEQKKLVYKSWLTQQAPVARALNQRITTTAAGTKAVLKDWATTVATFRQ